jgi:DNA ligase D-like protein (predicted ligase)
LKAAFIEPMESRPADTLPTDADWTYEVKIDGYRAEVIRRGDKTLLYSRNGNDLTRDFQDIAESLEHLPDGTIIDGELAALDPHGRPRFTLMQNRKSANAHVVYFVYFVFNILMHKGKDLTKLPLSERRKLIRSVIEPSEYVSISEWTGSADSLVRFVHEHQLEGIVAKRADSIYQPGKRTGSWVKVQVHRSQEFVIGGYTPSHLGLDALVVGFYRGKELQFAARVRAGFTSHSRRVVFNAIHHLETSKCPFVNIPDKQSGRWGQGMTVEKMKECIWLRPETVAKIEFAEWTPGDRLRQASFAGLRYDKKPGSITKE